MNKRIPLAESGNSASRTKQGFVEMDPTGRYGRFKDVLGKGAMKTVYKAFDEVLGMEVAWNQVAVNNAFRTPEDLQRLYCEVHLLKNLKHSSIIKFYSSWIDVDHRTFNFITEMFTSGTLREYRQKYRNVDIRAVKIWSRQILSGLAYLHDRDPPVIHRDLKCDNIFVNGHLGQVKIGDLGLAAILQGSKHAHSVIGTPEFMAPELYEEDYDELVDVYSFGMCVLEMLTSEYPYSECNNPAQIYKKVTSGKLPEAFYRIKDVDARNFVGKCLEKAPNRLPARELLEDPFLSTDNMESLRFPEAMQPPPTNAEGLLLDASGATDMTITGTMNPEEDTIFLKVQISDKDGHKRNIHFPFDINRDTAMNVAIEMVKELEITDMEPQEIAGMIEDEIINLVPSWKESEATGSSHHHSFSFEAEASEDDTNDANNQSSESLTSRSSSNPFLKPSNSIGTRDWLEGEHFIVDDASSSESITSFSNLALNYCSANESDQSPENPTLSSSQNVSPEKSKKPLLHHRTFLASNRQRRLNKIRSMIDIKSQLLQQSLLEQLMRRRFKTVASVENLGYRSPSENDRNKRTW